MRHQIEELIQSEVAAIKGFDQLLNRLNDQIERQQLSLMREDHVKALKLLKQFGDGELMGRGDAETPWGDLGDSFSGDASFFGDEEALETFRASVLHGCHEYRDALQSEAMDSDLREIIANEILPAQEQHIRIVESYLL